MAVKLERSEWEFADRADERVFLVQRNQVRPVPEPVGDGPFRGELAVRCRFSEVEARLARCAIPGRCSGFRPRGSSHGFALVSIQPGGSLAGNESIEATSM